MKETTKILVRKAEVCSTVSFRRLEKKLCLNRRQVRAALRRAENKGLLRYEEIAGRVYFRPTCATSIYLR